jgi:RNA polymerase sigma-70 factor (ECF subfamily)
MRGTVLQTRIGLGPASELSRGGVGVRGAEDEFTWFFVDQYPLVTRTVYFIVHDAQRAEDIAQDAFVQLLGQWSKVSRYEQPQAWVRRVAIRIAVRHLRRERMRSRREREAEPPQPPQPVDVDLLRAVAQLPAMQRAAVVLFYFEDRSMREVADILGCAESTSGVHLHRARKRLAELLGEEVGGRVD